MASNERLAVQRAQNTSAPHAAGHVGIRQAAQPVDAGVAAVARPQGVGLRAGAAHPHPHLGGQVGQGVEQDGEALALLVAADEQDRRASVGCGVALANRSTSIR